MKRELKLEFTNSMKEIYISKNKYIWFGKKAFSWKPYYLTNNASRFTYNEKVIALGWLWFCCQIVTEHYCDLIHIDLSHKYNIHYTENEKRFMGIMLTITKDVNHPYKQFMKDNFSFNYIDDVFYITANRKWLMTHGLGSLLQHTYPEFYMNDDELKRFPDYI